MKNKNLIAITALSVISCALSFASSFHHFKKAEAALTPKDVGSISFSIDHDTYSKGIYLIGDSTNEIPINGWENKLRSTDANSVVINGVDIYTTQGLQIDIKKTDDDPQGLAYFLNLVDNGYADREINDTVEISGNWYYRGGGYQYNLYIEPFSATWNGTKWVQNFIVPELETYDKFSLAQLSVEDVNRTDINTEGSNPSIWNTYTPSAQNTTNSFAFEFSFESFGEMAADTLDIRIGSSSSWDVGHYYQLRLTNGLGIEGWGEKGSIHFYEKNGTEAVRASGLLECDLTPGASHIIEAGSIYIKNKTKTYDYVKYDNQYLYQVINTPTSNERSTKVGIYYGQDLISLGNTIDQKFEDTLLFSNSTADMAGLYFDALANDIPFNDQEWTTRASFASKYNVLRNGEPMYDPNNGHVKNGVLAKISDTRYFLAFDGIDKNFVAGDVITLSGEFHFYENNKAYTLAVLPAGAEYDGSQFVGIDNLDEYYVFNLNEYYTPANYDSDKLILIENIISDAETNLAATNYVKDKFDIYNQAMLDIDEVPMNEEAAAAALAAAKTKAINVLNSYLDEDLYLEEHYALVQGYVTTALTQINEATTVKQVNQILKNALSQIQAVPTKQEVVESKILNLEEGYEDFLEKYDVVTTTDLSLTGDLHFYAKDSENESANFGDITDIHTHFPTKDENTSGNVKFKFKYESTNPLSNEHGAQLWIRLRGRDHTSYRFAIASGDGTITSVIAQAMNADTIDSKETQSSLFNFVANQSYDIELGAIDVDGFDRTFLYIKINTEFVVKLIVNKIDYNAAPTITITDSYTKSGSHESITISPLDNNTSKYDENRSTFVGRMKLDNLSTKTSLAVFMNTNNIPNDALLYPVSPNAFTHNGNELHGYRAQYSFKKVSGTTYTINLEGIDIADGDTIRLDGYFAYLDTTSLLKKVYCLSTSEFIYHADGDKWTQTPPTLAQAKEDAILYLSNYANLNNYPAENQTQITAIINEYTDKINAATTNEEVEALLNEGINKINAVPTFLTIHKNEAKEELRNYKSADLFRDNEVNELNRILNNAYARIDACTDIDSVDYIVLETKAAIDQLKTKAQYDAEELEKKKAEAENEIANYVALLESNRYTDENWATITELTKQVRADIKAATSVEQINQLLMQYKEAVKNVKTNDGSTFDGNKYNEKAKGGGGCHASIEGNSSIIFLAAIFGLVIAIRQIYKLRKEEK